MPKNPLKGFARRKSSGNILELQPEQPAQPAEAGASSFRVLERPSKAAPNGIDRRTVSQRPVSAMPFVNSRGKSTDDLGRSNNRGSGTTTLSGSSGYYDNSSSSARYSSSSTLPSSLDQEREQAAQDELFPPKGAQAQVYHSQHSQSQATAGAQNPSFAYRASRAMSFGRKKQDPSSPATDASEAIPALPDLPDNAAIRDRAMTASSYASTAVPPRLEADLGSADFSSDFGNMFEGLATSKKETPLPPPPRAHGGYMRSDPEPPLFPPKAASRQTATPSPELLYEPQTQPQQRMNRPQQLGPTKRYSWQSRTSHDGLISPGIESDMNSPYSSEFSQDTVKPPAGFSRFRPGYQPVPVRYNSPGVDQSDSVPSTPGFQPASQPGFQPASQPGFQPASQPGFQGRQPVRAVSSSSDEYASQNEEDTRPASRTEPKPLQHPAQLQYSVPAPPVARHPAVANFRDDMSSNDSVEGTSQNTTPRAKNVRLQPTEDDLFDVSPAGPASRAVYPPAQQARGGAQSPPKRMTKAQFEMQRAAPEDDESETTDGSDDGYDDGDEEERQAQLAQQRRRQEAQLAVYRQQMKKVSGGNPSELPSQANRPGMDRSAMSAPILQNGTGLNSPAEEEEDEDVPLGILAAHGFPNKNRPPAHFGSAPPTPGSQAGSVMGDPMAQMGGVLPPFARRLPQDPYFGASLVNPSNRETFQFGGNGGGSVYGSPAPSVQPGGLVGVIAGEERARAARRGSPNPATGGYGPIPLPNNMQMPPGMMPRSNSMMNVMPPQMGNFMPPQMQMQQQMMPGMAPMMSPMGMDPQQQMIQMMQMQQQMMQSIIQMQAGQTPNFNLPQSPSQQFLGKGLLNPNSAQRPMSMASNVGPGPGGLPNAGRSMTMNGPPPQWNDNAAQGRSNTMGSQSRPMGYAGSVYNYNLSAPAPGYTPSIAPSERSNVGMPSRYRPVSTMEANGGNSRTQTMTSNMGNLDPYVRPGSTPLPGAAVPAPKPTIRAIDKPKGTPKSPPPRGSAAADDEDDDAEWAKMRQKRDARKRRGTLQSKTPEPALSELYTNV